MTETLYFPFEGRQGSFFQPKTLAYLLRFRKGSLQMELIGNESLSPPQAQRTQRERGGSLHMLCVLCGACGSERGLGQSSFRSGSNFVNQFT
jgi:hypothetical protein